MSPPPLLNFQLLKSTRVRDYSKTDLEALAAYVLRREKISGPVDLTLDLTRPARLQAQSRHHPVRRELRLLFIHGILHLLGYTDYQPRPRRVMFRRQNQLLKQ